MDKSFINLYNNSNVARDYYKSVATGTSDSMKNISREQMYQLPLPLPPLIGQKRIVAKVDELMNLCDQLKAQIKKAEDTKLLLSKTIVENAVA